MPSTAIPTLRAGEPVASQSTLSDADVITTWGLVVEGYAAATAAIQQHIGGVFELPAAWFEVLLRLHRSPGNRLAMTQLAREVSFSSGGFTKLADRIEAGGYIERCACPNDRRVTWIALTPSGIATISAATALHAQWLRDNIVTPLGPELAEHLSAAMGTLRDIFTERATVDGPSPSKTDPLRSPETIPVHAKR